MGRSCFISTSCQATPLGGGTSGDHTYKCGVSFEHPHSLRRHGSFRPGSSPPGQSPGASRQASVAACRRPVKAVSTHYMALGRAATGSRYAPLGVDSVRVLPHETVCPESSPPPVAGRRWPITRWPASLGPLGAGFQPAVLVRESNPRQPDYRSGALSTELTWLTRPSVRTHVRNTRRRPPRERTGRRAPLAWPYHCSKERRWESNPLEAALQAAALPSGSSAKSSSVLARSRTWSSTFAGSRANPPHSEDVFHFSAPPRNRTSSGSFEDCHAIRHTRRASLSVSTRTRTWIWTFGGSYAIPCTIETFSVPTWSRTRARALGEPCAIRYTIGTNIPEPTTGFAPASMRFTGPPPFSIEPRRQSSRSARIRTPSGGFGDRFLSQEDTPVSAPGLATGGLGVTTTLSASRSSTLR